jgi:S1-C subfamily serine protease
MREQLKLADDAPGVVIVSVDPESDAAEEGLGPRLVITAVDDKPVTSVGEWSRLVKALKPGDTVKIDAMLGARNEIFFLSVPQPKSK